MANLEERVRVLEGQSDRHANAIDGVRAEIVLMRSEMADLRREMGDLRSGLNRHFVWLTGIMVSGFITMIGAMVAVVFQINSIR